MDVQELEFALMVDHEDGSPVEFVPAKSVEHAESMARALYAGRPSWTVGRERQPWRYVTRSTVELSDFVADSA